MPLARDLWGRQCRRRLPPSTYCRAVALQRRLRCESLQSLARLCRRAHFFALVAILQRKN
jgi:hypothetical protein